MEASLNESFLNLVRMGIGHPAGVLPETLDWTGLKDLAEKHGLLAVVLDGIEALRAQNPSAVAMPEKRVLTQWIGEVLQGYEYRYELYQKTIAEMARFYRTHGFRIMVLKGYACCLDWPRPSHRPTGDIDIWQFGQYREADAVLSSEKGIDVDNSTHHHTVFYWRDFLVENHYDFINVHHHRSHVALEAILKELGADDSYYTELYGEKVWLPSPDLHALFLMKHLLLHFSTGVISLRQLLDWGFFVMKHGKEVDWERIEDVFERFNMKTLYGIFNAVCVEDLGFDARLFNYLEHDALLKERVINDILCPEFTGETPSSFFPRVVFRFRRWKANGWKHRLSYSDSLLSAFWSGLWNHLLKPKSI